MKNFTFPAISTKTKKRLGRGTGSGKGNHTVGRGMKGQTSRVGKPVPLWFEGGQLPLIKKLPFLRGKSRFQSLNVKPQLVSLAQLEKIGEKDITPEILKKHNFIKNTKQPVKIVGSGTIKHAITLKGVRVSRTVKQIIEKAGGQLG